MKIPEQSEQCTSRWNTSSSVLSGLMGALASSMAKLAFDTGEQGRYPPNRIDSVVAMVADCPSSNELIEHTFNHIMAIPLIEGVFYGQWANERRPLPPIHHCVVLQVIVRGCCILGMILANIVMISTFVSGMIRAGSVAGVAVSTGASFIMSALLGYFLFQERYPPTWYLGFAMVCLGTVLLSNVGVSSEEHTSKGDDASTSGNQKKNL
jgi:drug/metabolite transporter (DMT)-like permease